MNRKKKKSPCLYNYEPRRSSSKKTRYPSTPRFRSPLTVRFYVRTTSARDCLAANEFSSSSLVGKGDRENSTGCPFFGKCQCLFLSFGAALIGRIAGLGQCLFEKIKKPVVVRLRKSHFLNRLFESVQSKP